MSRIGRPPGRGKINPHQIAFRAGDILPRLEERVIPQVTSEHTVARRDLARYYKLMALTPPPVTESEVGLIAEAVVSDDPGYLWADVADATKDTQKRFDVDATALSLKVRAMSAAEVISLLDLAERVRIVNQK
jgi:hypothetical protein